ncbi:unnamed protein product [Lactuca virosa]|uniref:Poly A polymerase head domain-containing protein n=1 Tax=Lactuca virosa TaxID=75947 RepID=A0AAU9PBS2_9ASTR|nr:unnamed protein product [Lactuca virosa]
MKKKGSFNIYPTDKEKNLFYLLCQVIPHFNLETQLRVAGGWVRDKLLGQECNDIDIAIDNMLGHDFCMKVNEYLASTGEERKEFIEIRSNPDKSKHLETARMRIWIDFVNLITPNSKTAEFQVCDLVLQKRMHIEGILPLIACFITSIHVKLKISQEED